MPRSTARRFNPILGLIFAVTLLTTNPLCASHQPLPIDSFFQRLGHGYSLSASESGGYRLYPPNPSPRPTLKPTDWHRTLNRSTARIRRFAVTPDYLIIERDPIPGTFENQKLAYILDPNQYRLHGPFDQAGFGSQTLMDSASLQWTDIKPPFWTSARLATFHNAPSPWPIVISVLPVLIYAGLKKRASQKRRQRPRLRSVTAGTPARSTTPY
ncbi:MAG: hypothetical protein AAGI68_06765 [Planctomycetota bacterium]